MTVHLSARLAWHDTGWNGRVCTDPLGNVSGLVHEHIRESRVDAEEVKQAGQSLDEIIYRPPCSRDPGAYSPLGFQITHQDPLEWRNLPPAIEDLPPYTVATSPYGRMFSDKGGWELDPVLQLENLGEFFDALAPERSLVFFYLKDGQPFVESSQRIVAGIGRIQRIGPQLYFGGTGDDKGRPYPIWARAITQNYPIEGFRLPLQEYHRNGSDPSGVLCFVPENLAGTFSYVAEHVTDDGAVTIIERSIECVRNVQTDNLVQGDWDRHLAWLDGILDEVWHDRGPYPGIGAVLKFLGCHSGLIFQHDFLVPLTEKGNDAWEFTVAILEGRREPVFHGHTTSLIKAGTRWRTEPKDRQELLRLLAHFAVTTDQVERITHPTKRADAGIPLDEATILSNPYFLALSL